MPNGAIYPSLKDRSVFVTGGGGIMTERQVEMWLTPGSGAEVMENQCL